MQEAEKFNALGVGNGFPYCLESVDVSTHDYWITLGGTQKGSSPEQDEIDLSLVNAMKLFWNYNGHTSSTDFGFEDDLTINIDQGEFKSLRSNNQDVSLPFAPINRTCLVTDYTAYAENLFGHSTIYSPDIVRMYNDDLFLGYGAKFLTTSTSFIGQLWYFGFVSYVKDVSSTSILSIDYSTALNGIPLLARSGGSIFDPDPEIIIDGLNATLYYGVNNQTTEKITYSNLNFYTY